MARSSVPVWPGGDGALQVIPHKSVGAGAASAPEGLHQTFISPMLQIETLTQSKCVIVLLDDLTSLDFASVPKLNSLLKQNVVLRLVLI